MSKSKEAQNQEQNQSANRQEFSRDRLTTDERSALGGQANYGMGRESRSDFPRYSTSNRGRNLRDSARASSYDQPRYGQREEPYSSSRYNEQAWRQQPRRRRAGEYSRPGESRPSEYENRQWSSEDSGDLYSRSIRERLRTDEYAERERPRRAYRANEPGDARRNWAYDNEFEDARGYNRQASRYEENEPARRTWSDTEAARHDPYAESRYGTEPWFDRSDRSGESYYQVRCRDLMTRDVTTCAPETSLREVAEMMESENVGSIPVVENGRLIGLVTDRDIVCRILADGRETRSTTAREAMTDDLITCLPEESVIDAIHKMGQYQVRRVPICDPTGRLRGILSMGDVALEAERDMDVARALEQISRPTPYASHRSW